MNFWRSDIHHRRCHLDSNFWRLNVHDWRWNGELQTLWQVNVRVVLVTRFHIELLLVIVTFWQLRLVWGIWHIWRSRIWHSGLRKQSIDLACLTLFDLLTVLGLPVAAIVGNDFL